MSIERRLARLERLAAPPADDPLWRLTLDEKRSLLASILRAMIDRDDLSAEERQRCRADLAKLEAKRSASWDPALREPVDEGRVAADVERIRELAERWMACCSTTSGRVA
jgi:hypothetical protein